MRCCTLITGPIHSGKSTLLKKMIGDFRARGLSVGGILAEALYADGLNAEGRGTERAKIGFDAVDISSGRKIPLVREGEGARKRELRTAPEAGDQKVGRFVLHGEGLKAASKLLLGAAGLTEGAAEKNEPVDVLCLDEVGPLEMGGQGYYPVLKSILESYRGELVLIGRSEIFEELAKLLKEEGWRVEPVSPDANAVPFASLP